MGLVKAYRIDYPYLIDNRLIRLISYSYISTIFVIFTLTYNSNMGFLDELFE